MTPAQVLAAAADRLDALADAATKGPWRSHVADVLHSDAAAWIGAPGNVTADGLYVASTANAPEGLNDAIYIAAMGPDRGKALAEWFRSEAQATRGGEGRGFGGMDLYRPNPRALALARMFIGDQS